MADLASLSATLSYVPANSGVAPINYTTLSASQHTPKMYQLMELNPSSTAAANITLNYPNAAISFLFVNNDAVNDVTVTIPPAGIPAHPYNNFTVANGGWFGGTIFINPITTITVTSTNANGSPCVLYVSGN